MKHKRLQFISLGAGIALALLALVSVKFLWGFVPLLLLYVVVLAWGASNIRSGFFVEAICSAPGKNRLALTFDDGPHENTHKVLEVLKSYQAPATFFCIGKKVEEQPGIVKKILEEGHSFGNHTYSHPPKWGWLKSREVKQEVEKAGQALQKVTGRKCLLFRPPFGVTNPSVYRALKDSSYKVIGWDLRSLDSLIKNEEKLYQRVIKRLPTSSIALFHDTQPHTPAVLARVLAYCKSAGIEIVPLEELLQIKTYEPK